MTKRLALGTAQFGLVYGVANKDGKVDSREVAELLLEASRLGVDTLDTAVAYGDSETVLGRIGVSKWNIVTKLPPLPEGCQDVDGWVFSEMRGSLQRLGVDHVDAVLLHRPNQLLTSEGVRLYQSLQRLKAEGMAQKIGVSIYVPNELDVLFEYFDFDLVQAPLSILDRRLVDSGWLGRLHRCGVELHARSVFLQGLLLMPSSVRPVAFQRWLPIWLEWERWLAENGLTPQQACLRYIFSLPEVARAVVGFDNVAQLRQIISSCTGALECLPNWPEHIDPNLLNPACWNQK